MAKRELLTVEELCEELKISRSTLNDWIKKRRAPKFSRLPNKQLRFDRRDVDAWLDGCGVAA
ncbi:helix-turn-helix domain-containing protein [Lentzea sp. NPDC004782]|uniref:helix-turn-helix transcriptional regulator n=1 Tax=Lentzea sp. NPDC004782 TaxID=3154458 RepID=UPI0033AF1FE7